MSPCLLPSQDDRPIVSISFVDDNIRDGASDMAPRIWKPHDNDVVCGRGKRVEHHPGNIYFRSVVAERKEEYCFTSSQWKKGDITRNVMAKIKALKPPGRFLEKDEGNPLDKGRTLIDKDGSWLGYWREVAEPKAFAKTSQALRQDAPEMRRTAQKMLFAKKSPVNSSSSCSSPLLPSLKHDMKSDDCGNSNEVLSTKHFLHNVLHRTKNMEQHRRSKTELSLASTPKSIQSANADSLAATSCESSDSSLASWSVSSSPIQEEGNVIFPSAELCRRNPSPTQQLHETTPSVKNSLLLSNLFEHHRAPQKCLSQKQGLTLEKEDAIQSTLQNIEMFSLMIMLGMDQRQVFFTHSPASAPYPFLSHTSGASGQAPVVSHTNELLKNICKVLLSQNNCHQPLNPFTHTQTPITTSASCPISSPASAMAGNVMSEEAGQNVTDILSTCSPLQMSAGIGPAQNISVFGGPLTGHQSRPNYQENLINQSKGLGHDCKPFKRRFEEPALMDRSVKARTCAHQNLSG